MSASAPERSRPRPAPTRRADAAPPPRRRSLWSPGSLVLIALMAAGSVVMWIGVPLALVYLVSTLVDSPRPGFGPYLLILIGLPVGMYLVGKVLGAIDRVHARHVGFGGDETEQAVWLRSMRDDRQRKRRRSVLEPVMVVSVGLAFAAMGVWFFVFAGSSLPGTS